MIKTSNNGIMEAIKRPKYRLPNSSLAKEGMVLTAPRLRKDTNKTAMPSIRQTFTMFEPKMFPTEIATCPVNGAMTLTHNSGSEVEKASKRKPIVVFPSPVASETLTEPVIAKRLPRSNITKKDRRTGMPTIISSINTPKEVN